MVAAEMDRKKIVEERAEARRAHLTLAISRMMGWLGPAFVLLMVAPWVFAQKQPQFLL